ncbi:hypothetical protein SAMD00019534_104960, partial [Acytostelium subglobosum LB1]|uniref:hypothetical protein n=1 Tax=Acytostelium subglobosum LB1 TaxID=1410327 RepID=UPI0006448B13
MNECSSIISTQDKQLYREMLLTLLTKFNHLGQSGKISIHLSIIISHVARIDYPTEWPTLFQSMFTLLEQGNDDNKKSAMITIKHILNELASRCFLPERQALYAISNQLFKFFSPYIENGTNLLAQVLEHAATLQQHLSSLEQLLMAAKIMRRIIQYGHTEYQESSEITKHFNYLFNTLSRLHSLRSNIIQPHTQTITQAQLQHPLSFIEFLPSSLNYFNQQILRYNPHAMDDNAKRSFFKKSLVQSLTFLKSVVDCHSYQTEMMFEDDDESEPISKLAAQTLPDVITPTHRAQQYVHQFFSATLLSELLKALVSNYLILTEEELLQWTDDPEEFILDIDNGAESNAYEIKPVAYSLFILLMRHFHEVGVKTVHEMLLYVTSGAMAPGQPQTTQQLLLKEACYMTIGLGYYDLYDNVNFDTLFSNVFMVELQMQDKRYNIIRRRICWLISYWIPKIPENMRMAIVQIILELTSIDDLVISLTAWDSLKAQITPFAGNIIKLISSMWNNGEAPHHLKSAIVRNLTLFLQAMNGDPSEYFTFLLPVIEQATMPNTEESIYLLEDGLELWFNLIGRINAFPRPLLLLFRNIIGVMQHTFEHSQVCMKILEAYILVGGQEFFLAYGNDVVGVLAALLGDIKDSGTNYIIRPIDLIIQMYPVDGAVLLQPVFVKLLQLIHSNDESELSIVQYQAVFTRLITMNPAAFFEFIEKLPHPQQVFRSYMESWFDKIDSIGSSEVRKLTSIAMSNMLAMPNSQVVEFIAQLVITTAGLRADINPDDFQELLFSEDGFHLPENSFVDNMVKKVQSQDPLYKLDEAAYFIDKLNESSKVHGALFQQQIQQVHPKVLELAFPGQQQQQQNQ